MLDPNIAKLKDSYNAVPYFSQAYSQSHPNRLATLGRLFNMSPAPITSCRVLELGCASGGNIIPMAYYCPDSRFVGVELAESHAAAGQKTIRDLGLKNIQIRHANILDVDESWGTFDYIICHGVFSWVPESVQDKILSIASDNLADEGVAYISYNTYPGWHMREMIRHMMLYHAGQFDDLSQRLGQARAFIDFLAGSTSKDTNDPYALLLKNELECLKQSRDWYIFHDYMEVVNTPIYFHQFIERAGKRNLQYLAESNFSIMFQGEFSQEISNTLEELSADIVQKEQYLDFLRNRMFRQTLLCKSNVELKRMLDADSLDGLFVASQTAPESEPVDIAPGRIHKFKTQNGMTIETENPILKSGLKILRQHWPEAIEFGSLLEMCMAELTRDIPQDYLADKDWKKELGRGLLHCYTSDLIEFHAWQRQLCTGISEFPKVNDLTLHQIKYQLSIVNHRHEVISIDNIALHLIPKLDGTHNRDAMLEHLTTLVENRTIILTEYDMPITAPEKIQKKLENSIDMILDKLLESGLLEE